MVEATGGLPAGDEGWPLTDGLFDRRDGAGHDDRRGDHHPAGDFLLDRQIGAQRQHGRLQDHAQELDDR
ncbi:hypothetical protein D3C87_1939240 [compost metagenome]